MLTKKKHTHALTQYAWLGELHQTMVEVPCTQQPTNEKTLSQQRSRNKHKRGPSTESWLVPAHAHAVLQKDPIPGFSPLLHQFGGVRPLPLTERNQAHSIRILHHLHPALVAIEGTRLQRARRTFSRSGLNGFLTEFQAVISFFCWDILGRTRTKRAGFVLHKGDGSAPEYLRQR